MYFHCLFGRMVHDWVPTIKLRRSLSLSIGSTIVFKAYLVGTKSNFIYSEKCLAFPTDGSKIACKNRDKIIVMDGGECNSENTFESYVLM